MVGEERKVRVGGLYPGSYLHFPSHGMPTLELSLGKSQGEGSGCKAYDFAGEPQRAGTWWKTPVCVIHPPPMPSSLRPAPLPKSSVSSLEVGGSRPTALVRGGCTLPKKEPVLGVEVKARVKKGKGLGARERSGR